MSAEENKAIARRFLATLDELTSICILRLADGKVAEMWVENNSLVFMLQLGVVPLPAGYFHVKE